MSILLPCINIWIISEVKLVPEAKPRDTNGVRDIIYVNAWYQNAHIALKLLEDKISTGPQMLLSVTESCGSATRGDPFTSLMVRSCTKLSS